MSRNRSNLFNLFLIFFNLFLISEGLIPYVTNFVLVVERGKETQRLRPNTSQQATGIFIWDTRMNVTVRVKDSFKRKHSKQAASYNKTQRR